MNVCTWQTIEYILHLRILTETAYIASLYDTGMLIKKSTHFV